MSEHWEQENIWMSSGVSSWKVRQCSVY